MHFALEHNFVEGDSPVSDKFKTEAISNFVLDTNTLFWPKSIIFTLVLIFACVEVEQCLQCAKCYKQTRMLDDRQSLVRRDIDFNFGRMKRFLLIAGIVKSHNVVSHCSLVFSAFRPGRHNISRLFQSDFPHSRKISAFILLGSLIFCKRKKSNWKRREFTNERTVISAQGWRVAGPWFSYDDRLDISFHISSTALLLVKHTITQPFERWAAICGHSFTSKSQWL